MREILFRGKRIDNKGWVEGLLTVMWGQYHIINPTDENTAYPIDSETVCQYTGLSDKNGRKIFEGDIVKVLYTDGQDDGGDVVEVKYSDKAASFCPWDWQYECDGCDLYFRIKEVEIVGNALDDSEKDKD